MKSAISFLKRLAQNNEREWFADNKKEFDTAKAEFEEFVAQTIIEIGKWNKDVRSLVPKDCIYRIHRDVRFSKNKTPYKTSLGALIGKDGRKGKGAINYLHIEPAKSFTAGGMYMPESGDLKAIRQEIDYNYKKFKTILTNKEFEAHFGELSQEWKLKTLPKGYAADNPAIEHLRLKSIVVSKNYTDKEVLASAFASEAAHSFKLVQPLNTFINTAIEGEKKELF